MELQAAIILCGGKATRMGELCLDTPKSLLKVDGLSILARQLRKLPKTMFAPFLAIGDTPHSQQFADFSQKFDCQLHRNLVSSPEGTGGAVHQIIRHYGLRGPVMVLNGDVLFQEPLTDMAYYHLDNGVKHSILGCGLYPVREYGELVLKKDTAHLPKVLAFNEKQNSIELGFINGGCYILDAQDYKENSSSVCSIERDVFPRLCLDESLHAYLTTKYWTDMGTPERFSNANTAGC